MKKMVRGYSALTTIILMAADFQKHFQISPLRRCCKHYRERGGASGFIKKTHHLPVPTRDFTILDCVGLEAVTCKCAQTNKETYQNILGKAHR